MQVQVRYLRLFLNGFLRGRRSTSTCSWVFKPSVETSTTPLQGDYPTTRYDRPKQNASALVDDSEKQTIGRLDGSFDPFDLQEWDDLSVLGRVVQFSVDLVQPIST